MIILKIEELEGGVNFKVDNINTATSEEKVVLYTILSAMNDNFEIDKSSTKLTISEQLEQEDAI